jgi:hypothetical protein
MRDNSDAGEQLNCEGRACELELLNCINKYIYLIILVARLGYKIKACPPPAKTSSGSSA